MTFRAFEVIDSIVSNSQQWNRDILIGHARLGGHVYAIGAEEVNNHGIRARALTAVADLQPICHEHNDVSHPNPDERGLTTTNFAPP